MGRQQAGSSCIEKLAGIYGVLTVLPGCNLSLLLQGLTLKDVQTALGEDCSIAPVFEYVSVPEEVTGAVDTVSASVADVNKVLLESHYPHNIRSCPTLN